MLSKIARGRDFLAAFLNDKIMVVNRLLTFALFLGCRCGLAAIHEPVPAAATPPLVCSSGGPIARVDLHVGSTRAGDKPLPLRTINRLEEGDTLSYRPILRAGESRKGEVSLVLVRAGGNGTDEPMRVLDAKPANKPAEWMAPWRVALVAFVYGPSGLNVRKVRSFLSNDTEIIGQLADYADKTTRTEALLAELSAPNPSTERLQSALVGFSSGFGANAQLSRASPVNQQAVTVFQALNPAVAGFDPLSAQPGAAARGTASLATLVAELFFGSPVGLAAGGTALLLNLRSVAFPNTEFRSSFSQPLTGDAMGLCGKNGPSAAHTRVSYIWAMRVPNVAAPKVAVGKERSLPSGGKSPLPVATSDPSWKFIDRARNWTLNPASGKPIPIEVQKLGDTKRLEIDLSKVQPGVYTLQANWDWDHFEIGGNIEVRALSDFKSARIRPASQDRLVGNTGKVPITLEDEKGDFEFVTKVQIEKLDDEFATPIAVPFVLPEGLRHGVQKTINIQIDTSNLQAGAYKLTLSQVDDKPHEIRFQMLPAPPALRNLPLVLNAGVTGGDFVLKGERLNLLKRLELARGTAELGPASDGQTERQVALRMASDISAGTSFSIRAYIAGRSEPLTFSDAVRIVGPRPTIVHVTVGRPPDQVVQLNGDELPGGGFLSAMLRVQHLQSNSVVKLSCTESGSRSIALHLGDRSNSSHVQQLTPNQLFVSFDTMGWPNDCVLQAAVANDGEGESMAYKLGRIVLIPSIESFTLSEDPLGGGEFVATLLGENLETVEKIGWTLDEAQAVEGLPSPVADGKKQRLQTHVSPPPDADAQLMVWLRNESKPRQTSVRAGLPMLIGKPAEAK